MVAFWGGPFITKVGTKTPFQKVGTKTPFQKVGTKNPFQKVGTKIPFKILQFVDTSTTCLENLKLVTDQPENGNLQVLTDDTFDDKTPQPKILSVRIFRNTSPPFYVTYVNVGVNPYYLDGIYTNFGVICVALQKKIVGFTQVKKNSQLF